MRTIRVTLQQTLQSLRLLWLLYGITLVLGLVVALPFYNTLKVEDQNSLAFLKLLNGFDYTVYSDFMHRSQRVISPLFSVGRWLGALYIFLSVFVAGGILLRFSQLKAPFNVGTFLQACSHYVGRFLRLFGVSLLFVIVGGGIWLVIGSLLAVLLNDTLTERGQFWLGAGFFGLFALTVTLVLCIGDYAKVLMFTEDEQGALRAFGRAGRLVLRNLARTYGIYWLFIGIGTLVFGVYFLVDDAMLMNGWLTIVLMVMVQQALVLARVLLKVWSLGTAYTIYGQLPKLIPALRSLPVPEQVYSSELVSVQEEKPEPPLA